MLSDARGEDSISKSYAISKTVLHTIYGALNTMCFSWGPSEEDNILCLYTRLEQPLLTRIQSACCTGEVFRSLDCDCYDQLQYSLKRIVSEGGALFYLFQEGRGAGIYLKIKAMGIANAEGKDIVEVHRNLGIAEDSRGYYRVAEVLHDLQMYSIRLLTNNPAKIKALTDQGISVSREPIQVEVNKWNIRTLRAKREKLGHFLNWETK